MVPKQRTALAPNDATAHGADEDSGVSDGRKDSQNGEKRTDEDCAVIWESGGNDDFEQGDTDKRANSGQDPGFVLERELGEPGEGREWQRLVRRFGVLWRSISGPSPQETGKLFAKVLSDLVPRPCVRSLQLRWSIPGCALVKSCRRSVARPLMNCDFG